jgi:hypothetical protein
MRTPNGSGEPLAARSSASAEPAPMLAYSSRSSASRMPRVPRLSASIGSAPTCPHQPANSCNPTWFVSSECHARSSRCGRRSRVPTRPPTDSRTRSCHLDNGWWSRPAHVPDPSHPCGTQPGPLTGGPVHRSRHRHSDPGAQQRSRTCDDSAVQRCRQDRRQSVLQALVSCWPLEAVRWNHE